MRRALAQRPQHARQPRRAQHSLRGADGGKVGVIGAELEGAVGSAAVVSGVGAGWVGDGGDEYGAVLRGRGACGTEGRRRGMSAPPIAVRHHQSQCLLGTAHEGAVALSHRPGRQPKGGGRPGAGQCTHSGRHGASSASPLPFVQRRSAPPPSPPHPRDCQRQLQRGHALSPGRTLGPRLQLPRGAVIQGAAGELADGKDVGACRGARTCKL